MWLLGFLSKHVDLKEANQLYVAVEYPVGEAQELRKIEINVSWLLERLFVFMVFLLI